MMKKILLIVVVALVSAAAFAQNVHIVAHRGFWDCDEGGHAQNSIASLRAAQNHTFWGSEFDLRLSADDVVVVNHDEDIHGHVIRNTKWRVLKKEKLANGEHPSTIDQYLDQGLKSPDTRLILELKPLGDEAKEDILIDKVVSALRKRDLFHPDRAVFISFSLHICEVIAERYPEFTNQYLEGDLSPKELSEKKINGFDYEYTVLYEHPEWIGEAHELGLSTNTWTVDNQEDMLRLIDMGVQTITTNDPLLLRKLLSEKTFDTEACELNLIGKLCPETPKIYNRVDTLVYGPFNKRENELVRMSSGLAVLFKTNSPEIQVVTDYEHMANPTNSTLLAQSGYDLYIKKDKDWLWAGTGVAPRADNTQSAKIISSMDGSMHECLMYLPLYSMLNSVKIRIPCGYEIESIESPFRHRVAIFGSSFTHGASCSRAGMPYPAIFTRETGIQLLSLGMSGNSKLQPAIAKVIADADIDALIIDAFSNPTIAEIEERIFPFIEIVQAAHPDIPIIFQRTIYREKRNFNTEVEKKEQDRIDRSVELVKQAQKKYKNIYLIYPDATSPRHDTSVDGTHPGDYGYWLWAQSIEKPVLKILRKYGLK